VGERFAAGYAPEPEWQFHHPLKILRVLFDHPAAAKITPVQDKAALP
jgi:hypothetical protein